MGCIFQDSATAANSSFATASFWFIPPTLSADMARLGPDLFRCSAIGSDYTRDTTAFRIFYTVPQSGDDAGSNIFEIDAGSDNDGTTGWLFKDTISVNGKWSHCFTAVDTSFTTSIQHFPIGNPEVFTGGAYMYVNLNRLPARDPFGSTYSLSTLPSFLPNSGIPFEMDFNLKTIGIPSAPQRLDYTTISPGNPQYVSPKIQFAEFQMWVGTFIDPTIAGNLDKFVTVKNGIGRPVDPKIAEAAFGKPTFRFAGNKTGFVNNTGIGGAFVKTGTINDFTPAPGQ